MAYHAKQEAKMEDIRSSNLNAMLAEAKALSTNRVIMQSQEGAHVVNLLCRVIEEDIRSSNLKAMLAEAKALSTNRVIMQSQEGAHVVNLLCRVIETIVDCAPNTKPISTHHS